MRDLAVRQTIEDLGTTEMAAAMGLPISTVHGWKSEDRIPGQGAAHAWRVRQFKAAAKKLRRKRPTTTRKEAA